MATISIVFGSVLCPQSVLSGSASATSLSRMDLSLRGKDLSATLMGFSPKKNSMFFTTEGGLKILVMEILLKLGITLLMRTRTKEW